MTEKCDRDKEKLRELYEHGKEECQRNVEEMERRFPNNGIPDNFVTKARWDEAVEQLDMERKHWVDEFLLYLGYDRCIEYSCDSDCSCSL